MVFNNNFSDYGSGNSSTDSSLSFGGQEAWSSCQQRPPQLIARPVPRKSSSFIDLVMGRCTLDDVMQEFRMNGSDSPYNPDEDRVWTHRADELIGMGPSGAYLRQKSWPEPERTPIAKLPTLPTMTTLPTPPTPPTQWMPSTSMEFIPAAAPIEAALLAETQPLNAESITEEQIRVLTSLPNNVLYSLLRELEQGRYPKPARAKRHPDECRFCKNNGEREAYYRSHSLKDSEGRVACPVLRAFVCKRCGARGDRAHTLKYCPLSTNEERVKSAAMMRSVRLASGRRRDSPLDPVWAALEQKLML